MRLTSTCITLLAALLAPVAVAQTVVFEGVRPIDVATGTVEGARDLAVRDGWIVESAAGDASVLRIDARGRYLVPGLAEMHAHVPPVDAPQRVDDVLALFLAHGVTTIRGMLGEPGHLVLRAELARGERIGPRLLTSGPSLNGNSVPDPGTARRLVRQQAEAGYDLLKLHPGLMPDRFEAIDAAADGLGIGFAGHVSIGVGIERALAAGQATIDHLDGYAQVLVPESHPARQRPPGFFGLDLAEAMDEDRISAWARRTADAGVWNVPTQTLIENLAVADLDAMAARPSMRWVSQSTQATWRRQIRSLREGRDAAALARFVELRRGLIRALHESGAGLLAGADAPQVMNVPGDSLHHELGIYVDAGLSPAEALATATTRVAEFLGESARGCLRPGCVADLVLVEADPLADIANLRRISGVMRAGAWFDRERLDAMLDDVAARAEPTGPG